MTLTPIVAKRTGEGDFVHETQPMNRTFRNVSDLFIGSDSWAWKEGFARTFDQLVEDINNEKNIRYDVGVSAGQLSAVLDPSGYLALNIDNGDFKGISFFPSDHVVNQLGSPALQGYGATVLNHLMEGDEEERNLAVELVNKSLSNWAKARGDKSNIIRVRMPNGLPATVRAILTERFARIDHDFLVETVAEALPEGVASHIRWEDGDTLRFNALIPDFLRKDEDSEFGAMLACRNSEIGTGRISTQPSLFRAICANGCIWGRHQGKSMDKVHKGKVNLVQMKADILQNLMAQIPLVETGYLRMQSMRDFKFDAAPEQLVTWFAKNGSVTVTKSQARTLLSAYVQEPMPNAYGFLNAVTRAAQAFGNSVQESWEYAAGDYLNAWADPNKGRSRWDGVVATAHNYDKEDVDRLLVVAA